MSYELYEGYKADFLGNDFIVDLPTLSDTQKNDLVSVDGADDHVARYINYSLMLSSSRRLPFFTASNIDGSLFKRAVRDDNWRKDERINESQQLGKELYGAEKSDFDKGHMTKREDVQWGDSIAIASKAADSTFFYTNAVPQHAKLNQKIWRNLEDYVLHTEAKENKLKISVFTGPVLGQKDPYFVTPVNGERIEIPILFWKVIVFTKSDQSLYRAGFLMSQSSLLYSNEIVEERLVEVKTDEDRLFMQFTEADTYQVNVSTIERLTKLTLPSALEPFTDDRKIKLILKEIDVKASIRNGASIEQQLGFEIAGLLL